LDFGAQMKNRTSKDWATTLMKDFEEYKNEYFHGIN
jgi:hypothetical protein